MKIEVWCQRGLLPECQPKKIGDFECDFMPREGDFVNVREGWCAFIVMELMIDLLGNSVRIEIPWVDFDADGGS